LIIAVIMAAAFVLVPVSGADGAYHSISGEKSVIAVDEDADFTIIYTDSGRVIDVTFDAKLVDSKGETMTSAVVPSTGDIDNGVPTVLTVSAPSKAGTYTLVVTYSGTVETPDGSSVDIDPASDRYDIKVVEPITLTVDVSLKDPNVNLSGYGVYFWVDGEKMEDSFDTFSVNSKGTGSVSYDWVADASKGKHVFWVESANGGVVEVEGLNEKHEFYIGDVDYTVYIVLAILFVILVIILLVWVYRKPVKNFGKPKARRK
jgi:hypothetical protein